ncbi:hypothetical protein [Tateyamaria sp. SN6-1]|uniref:hypothetical protein n=1 Tax=Tateyamaria sp. SN6-1 TaxID=3092148 RepID=UPI0039F5D1A5
MSVQKFAAVDARVEVEHDSKHPGFVCRETGAIETGNVAVGHWETAEDAQASMNS